MFFNIKRLCFTPYSFPWWWYLQLLNFIPKFYKFLGGKLLDPSTLKPFRTFKMDVPTNACSISPLMNSKSSPKYHVLLAGGVSARIAA